MTITRGTNFVCLREYAGGNWLFGCQDVSPNTFGFVPGNYFEHVEDVDLLAKPNSTSWPMQSVDAPDASVNQLDREVWQAHNDVRTNPKSFIAELEAKLPLFEGKLLKRPG